MQENDWNKVLNFKPLNVSKQVTIRQDLFANLGSPNVEYMKANRAVRADFEEKDLISDPVTGWNGGYEYDYSYYVTKLKIVAYMLNTQFQKDCKLCLTPTMLFVNQCEYKSAPVKTKQRCIFKAKTDYIDTKYPHCGSILDVIRCSVSFVNAKDLVVGLKNFISMVSHGRAGCIKKVFRIKNVFENVKQWKKSGNDSSYSYCDIKLNVWIQHGEVSMIGEIQFLLV